MYQATLRLVNKKLDTCIYLFLPFCTVTLVSLEHYIDTDFIHEGSLHLYTLLVMFHLYTLYDFMTFKN